MNNIYEMIIKLHVPKLNHVVRFTVVLSPNMIKIVYIFMDKDQINTVK